MWCQSQKWALTRQQMYKLAGTNLYLCQYSKVGHGFRWGLFAPPSGSIFWRISNNTSLQYWCGCAAHLLILVLFIFFGVMIELIDCTINGLFFVQLILNCCQFCRAPTWMLALLLLAVSTTSTYELVKCEVMGSNLERDKHFCPKFEFWKGQTFWFWIRIPDGTIFWYWVQILNLTKLLKRVQILNLTKLFVMGSIPKWNYMNSIDLFKVLGWIPRGSCININWCRFRNCVGSDNNDDNDSLSGPVA